MEYITATEFQNLLSRNPSVFEHWDTPLNITEYINCTNSPITHLSKHLIFSGTDENGNSAHFFSCPNLKVATGTFDGYTCFTNSAIQKIEDLFVREVNELAGAASFFRCKELKIATGTYAGYVNFLESGIHSIHNLHIETSDEDGHYATLNRCPNLKNLGNWDLSKKVEIEEEKLEAERRRRKSLQKFVRQTQAPELPFL
jgi:hypothetical protein